MTQDKELLLKDLCGRLPYGVKVQIKNVSKICILEEIDCSDEEMSVAVKHENGEMRGYDFYLAKPYLFPMSSITEEQRTEASLEFGLKKYTVNIFGDIESYSEIGDGIAYIGLENIGRYIDWLNKNHFDYRGLIEKGLAIDATGLNIY